MSAAVAVEFEHFIGINTIANGVAFHPNGTNYLFAAGGNIVVGDLTDPHSQEFMRMHDDNVTCLTLSRSGSLVASGQRGESANVYVWNFSTRKVIYTFEEHDSMIQGMVFSEDEKILITIGDSDDHKIIIWDLSTGNVISSSNKLPAETNCVAFGGFVRDIKRRDTDHYQICTAGRDGLMLWDLNPFSGEFESFKLVGDARATINRHVTAVAFSEDKEYIYAATTSGDFVIASMRYQRIIQAVQATKMGLGALLALNSRIVIGCGDSTVKFFDSTYEFQGQVRLDGPVIGLSLSPDHLEVCNYMRVCFFLRSGVFFNYRFLKKQVFYL